jgi:hypothetical protein
VKGGIGHPTDAPHRKLSLTLPNNLLQFPDQPLASGARNHTKQPVVREVLTEWSLFADRFINLDAEERFDSSFSAVAAFWAPNQF